MDVLSILKSHNLRPSKGLGQNFLIDLHVMDKIVEAGELCAEDVVLEVGPGVGALTRRIAERAGQVVAVELDRKMLPILRETLANQANVHLVEKDILAFDLSTELPAILGTPALQRARFKVIANLPYYITSAAVRHLLAGPLRPERLVLMVQHEVAQRILAGPDQQSLLAISVRIFGDAELVYRVPAGAFYPRPKVNSAVLLIRTLQAPRITEEELPWFFRVVRAGFGQKRKQLHNSLSGGLAFDKEIILQSLGAAGVDPARRPQTLSLDEWARLSRALPRLEEVTPTA
jgi:16S rRNA (adenine1518-N6/adenine1519-N6)-dimethyltransferase